MAEIITRKWVNGKCVKETKSTVDWKPNAADLDLIMVKCECEHKFDIPCDVAAFCGLDGMYCGQCGEAGKIDVIEDQ